MNGNVISCNVNTQINLKMKSPARQNVRPELRARGAGLAHLGNGYPAIGTRTSSSAAQLPGHALLMRRVRLLRARGDGERGSGWS